MNGRDVEGLGPMPKIVIEFLFVGPPQPYLTSIPMSVCLDILTCRQTVVFHPFLLCLIQVAFDVQSLDHGSNERIFKKKLGIEIKPWTVIAKVRR